MTRALLILVAVSSGCWLALDLDDKRYTLPHPGAGGGGENGGQGGSQGGGGLGGGGEGGGGSGGGDACAGLPPMPAISRNVPAEASHGVDPPGWANDSDYRNFWRSFANPPVWLAYDLSGVDVASRQQIVAVFYNASPVYNHVEGIIFADAYNNLGDYVLEASAAPGGDLPDETSWEELVSVQGNTFNTRQHAVDLEGRNWIRVRVTASDGSVGNTDVEINFDVHDAHAGLCDDWIVFGDKLTQHGLHAYPPAGLQILAQVVEGAEARFPLIQNGGMEYYTADDGRQHLIGATGWLDLFPGRYVGLAFGWQDALDDVVPDTFHDAMRDMIEAVLALGKVPILPKIAWSPDVQHAADIPALNAEIDLLLSEHRDALPGPDLWTALLDTPSAFSGDGLTDSGVAIVQQSWADAMSAIYAAQ